MKSINFHVVAGLDNCSRFLQLMGLAKILTSHPQYRMSHFRIYGFMGQLTAFVTQYAQTAEGSLESLQINTLGDWVPCQPL